MNTTALIVFCHPDIGARRDCSLLISLFRCNPCRSGNSMLSDTIPLRGRGSGRHVPRCTLLPPLSNPVRPRCFMADPRNRTSGCLLSQIANSGSVQFPQLGKCTEATSGGGGLTTGGGLVVTRLGFEIHKPLNRKWKCL
jgi:hypothetical protein